MAREITAIVMTGRGITTVAVVAVVVVVDHHQWQEGSL